MNTSEESLINKLRRTGFVQILGSNVVVKIINLISNIVIVRILSKQEYGQLTYALNIFSFILLFNGMGMSVAFVQLGSENFGADRHVKGLFQYAIKLGFLFDILISVVIYGLAIFAPLTISGSSSLLKLLCFIPILSFLYEMINAYLRSNRRNKEYAKLAVIESVISLALVAALTYIKGVRGWIYSRYITVVICIYAGIRFLNFGKREHIDIPAREKKDLLKIAIISSFNDAISSSLHLLDIFILGIILPNEEVLSTYKVATIIPTAMFFIPTAVVFYVYPYFAEHSKDLRWCYFNYKRLTKLFFLVNAILTVIIIIISPLIVRVLYGEKYIDGVPVFCILMLNYLVSSSFLKISGNILASQRALKFNTVIVAVAGIVNVIGDIFMIKMYGSIGAAVSTLATSVIASIIAVVFCVKKLRT